MEKIVIFGKGGIGKSTIAVNLAVSASMSGKKVLLLGCDPKHDTTMLLTGGQQITTVVNSSLLLDRQGDIRQIVTKGKFNIDCLEAGGPEPGIGCAGRGISRMLELLSRSSLLKKNKYDLVLFDVLGDVVCGGFAAPLRKGFARKVCIVVSEQLLTLYAANNIAKVIKRYSSNGIFLAGLIANMAEDNKANRAIVKNFANLLETDILTFFSRDKLVQKSEYDSLPVIEAFPEAPFSKNITSLLPELIKLDSNNAKTPKPLSDEEFHEISQHKFRNTQRRIQKKDYKNKDIASSKEVRSNLADKIHDKFTVTQRVMPKSYHYNSYQKWWNFLCLEYFKEEASSMITFRGDLPVSFYEHGDLECKFSHYEDGGSTTYFFNYPWLPSKIIKMQPGSMGDNLITDIKEDELIKGTDKKLGELQKDVIANSKKDNYINIKSMCTPTVIGDDIGKTINRCRQQADCPVIYLNPRISEEDDFISFVLRKIDLTRQGNRKKCGERRVNLLGFDKKYREQELIPLLAKAGIKVNICVLPDIDLKNLRNFANADVNICYKGFYLQEAVQKWFGDFSVPFLEVPAPYGVKGSYNCFLQIGSFFKRDISSLQKRWDDFFQEQINGINALKEKANRHKLGFIIDKKQKKYFRKLDLWGGVNILEYIEDLGFKVTFFIYLSQDYMMKFNNKKLQEQKRRIYFFSDPYTMFNLIGQKDCSAIYSDFSYDQRLIKGGVNQFSLRNFKMGVEGARETLEELLGICNLSFYDKYQKFLLK
jgi:nitrogenase iron protein NifH